MKIYNQDGKLIHKLPSYQQGGFILPTYTPPQVSLQTPGNSQQLFAATDKTTSDNWSRYVQGTQLNLQAAQTTQSMLHANVDLKLRMQNQERVNKQLELQNKKFEFEMLKAGANEIEEIMKMDDDFVLDRDRPVIDNLLKQNKLDDESMANSDARDLENIFKKGSLKRSLMYAQTNLITNKKKFTDISTQLATSEDLLKRADTLSKLGYLDNKALNDTLDAFNNVRKKQLEFANGTLPDIDLATDPDYLKISQFQDIIDEKQQKAMQDLQMKEQESEIRSRQSTAMYNEQKAINDAQRLPYEIDNMKAKTQSDIVDYQIKAENQKLYDSLWNDWTSKNPNATPEEKLDFRNKLQGRFNGTAKDNTPTSPDQLWTYGVLTGNDDYVQKAEEYKQLNNNKTTEVSYKYDGLGNKVAAVSKDGTIDYGGRTVDKDGVTVTSVTIGGEKYSINSAGENKGKVIGIPDATLTEVNGTGFLKIKGDDTDNLKWIFGKYPKYGSWYTNDSLDDFATSPQAPTGTKYEGGYLYLPQDNIALPNTPSNEPFIPTESTVTPAPSGKAW